MWFQQSPSPGVTALRDHSPESRVSAAFVAISIHSLPGSWWRFARRGGGSRQPRSGRHGARPSSARARSASSCIGIEIDRFLETVLGSPAVAGRLADHSHQIISGRSESPSAEGAARRRRLPRRTAPGWPARRPGPVSEKARAGMRNRALHERLESPARTTAELVCERVARFDCTDCGRQPELRHRRWRFERT